jgi:hypothetical protein
MKQKIFMIDSLGALVSAIFLLILAKLEPIFGMPKSVLSYLIPIPFVFCAFSAYAYYFSNQKWGRFLRAIAIANLLYCAFTFFLVFKHFTNLTKLGLAYFVMEILIVVALAGIEWRIANRSASRR